MNAYNPIAAMQRLRSAGVAPKQAEILADELHNAMQAHVTHEQLKAALDAQTIRIVGLLGALIVGAVTVLGVILS